MQERLFSTWHQLEQDLYDADDVRGRAGYRRVWPTLRKACEAAGIDPIELDANRFRELADSKRWTPRTRCLLLKVARYAGLDLARSETLEPADVDPSLTAPLRRLAMRPASAPEVRNTLIAGLVWQWPASGQRLRVLEVAHLTAVGGDLLLSTGDAAARRLQGLIEHYSAWRNARAAVGVDDAPMLFCALPTPVARAGARAGDMLSARGLQATWRLHCTRRIGSVVPYDTYRRAAIGAGAAPVDRGVVRSSRLCA